MKSFTQYGTIIKIRTKPIKNIYVNLSTHDLQNSKIEPQKCSDLTMEHVVVALSFSSEITSQAEINLSGEHPYLQ